MDVLQAIRERRSINFFEPDVEIADEKIHELISLANLAPSSFNLQPWRLIIVKDKEKKKILRQCALNQPKIEEASAVFIIIADPGAVELNAERVLNSWIELGYIKEEQRDTYRGLMAQLYGEEGSLTRKLFAAKNASIFAMSIMITARGMGFETHPMDGFDEACIRKAFGIPDDKIIPMLIAVGYLKKGITLFPRAFRRNIQEFVGKDSYK